MNNRKHKRPLIFGIIGDSLDHSLSPAIHNHYFSRQGLTATYTTFPVEPKNLASAVDALRVLGISGVNITNPYKEQIIPLLDGLTESAQRSGAVNTIKNVRHRLIGHNTDITGIQATLRDKFRQDLRGRDAFLLGSGGVARACLTELARFRVNSITILARAPVKARKMATLPGKRSTEIAIRIKSLNELARHAAVSPPAVVLNATSMPPRQAEQILKTLARANNSRPLTFFDLNYGERAVPSPSRPPSIKYIDGLYMLAVQAAESFRIWTGSKLDPKAVYRYIRRKQQEN